MEIDALNSAEELLYWDQSTYMPPGGAAARARQIAALGRIIHEKFTDPVIGELLEEISTYEKSLPYDSDEAALLRITRRDYERATKLPSEFMEKLYRHTAESFEVWVKARAQNNFAAVQPYLEKTLDFSRQYAQYFSGYDHIADPFIAEYDYGMKTATVRKLFAELRQELVPLVQNITCQPEIDASFLYQEFPEQDQLKFAVEVIKRIGYDFERGRMDKTHHPYMIKFSLGDVRITTRVKIKDLSEALFSSLHEAGHALYEMSVCKDYEGTPLAQGASAGFHESQSRLWENMIGRSKSFWKFFYPQLQRVFPKQMQKVTLDDFYRAINKVKRSLIRTDADEVTYNLHVMIRFDLEIALLENKLAVRDLPEAWRERYQSDLGIVPDSDSDGVLQDVHWYQWLIGGGFQGYTLGNLTSAQVYETALQHHPQLIEEIENGNFANLRNWLTQNIYQYGRKYTASELIARTTEKPISIRPYMTYLNSKYKDLYNL